MECSSGCHLHSNALRSAWKHADMMLAESGSSCCISAAVHNRQLEEMLNKLQPEGSGVGQASRAGPGDNDPTTSTLQDAMDRLHGQHLSGSGDGVDVGSFMTPAGARCPRGPPNEVSPTLGQPVYIQHLRPYSCEYASISGHCALWRPLHPCNAYALKKLSTALGCDTAVCF